MRRLVLAFACSTAAVSLARAQPKPKPPAPSPPPDPIEKVRARALLLAGNDLVKHGRQRDAIDLFNEAYQLFPSSAILLNLGIAHRALGDFVESSDAYQRILDDPAHTAVQVATAQSELAQLDKLVARVSLVVETTDATPVELALDGSPWIGLPVSHLLRLTAGAHHLQARGGGVTFVTDADIAAVAGVAQIVTLHLVAAPPPPVEQPPPIEEPPPVVVAPPPDEVPIVEVSVVPRHLSRFGALVHVIVPSELDGATGVVGATFAPRDRITLSLGAMAGGNTGGFAGATYALVAGRLRPTVTAGVVVAHHHFDETDSEFTGVHGFMAEGTLLYVGAHGALGGEWLVSRRFSAIAEVGFDYYLSATPHIHDVSIMPTVGLHARL